MKAGTPCTDEGKAASLSPTPTTKERICPQCAVGLSWPDYADVVVCSSCGSTLAADAALRAVQCPQCAGPLAAVGGLRLLACCHCGVHVLVSSRGGHDRWRLPLRTDRAEAERAARGWLAGRPDIAQPEEGSPSRRRNSSTHPCGSTVPWWRGGSSVIRRGSARELVGDEDNERLELQPYREEVQEGRLQERRFYEAAADLSIIGATRPRVTGREPLLPVLGGDLDDARVLPAQGSPASVLERGHRQVLQPTSAAERPEGRLLVVRESACLLFYPLWVLELRQGARRYSLVVNGFEGTVNSAIAPVGTMARIKRRLSRVAALAALALTPRRTGSPLGERPHTGGSLLHPGARGCRGGLLGNARGGGGGISRPLLELT